MMMTMRIIAITITKIAPTVLPTTVPMKLEEPPAEVDFGGEGTVGDEDGVRIRMVVKIMT